MDEIPKPVQKKMRWPFPIVWIVPIAAAALAGYFLYQRHQEQGISITVQFNDGEGIKEGETAVAVRGVAIGKVNALELSPDHQHVLAHIRLSTANGFVAHADTQFWLVRPEVSLESIKGLNTLVSGPFINVQPGGGADAVNFVALDGPPIITGPGIKIILHADQVGQLIADSPVFYRGIQVGSVQDIRLSSDSTNANVTIYIYDHYKFLIRTHTEFWTVKGADIQGSIFSGLKLQLGSLRTLIGGGITFATPEKDYGEFIQPNATFELHDQPEDKWLKWKPKIELPDDTAAGKTAGETQPEVKMMSGLKHE